MQRPSSQAVSAQFIQCGSAARGGGTTHEQWSWSNQQFWFPVVTGFALIGERLSIYMGLDFPKSIRLSEQGLCPNPSQPLVT